MKYHYPYVSNGYTGLVCSLDSLTLNARFYSLFHGGQLECDAMFPQRVPRMDYFVELDYLEEGRFKRPFEEALSESIRCVDKFKREPLKGFLDADITVLVFHMNYLLRQGQFQSLHDLPIDLEPYNFFRLEVALLVETARIELALCSGQVPCLEGLASIAKLMLDVEAPVAQKIRVINRLIVYACRHGGECSDIKTYLFYLWELLEGYSASAFADKVAQAVGYRGIAMSDVLSPVQREHALSRCEKISRELKAAAVSVVDEIIYAENLYNVLQTLSKWAGLHKNWSDADKLLHEMMRLDPLDSTAFTEHGVLKIRLGEYDQAIESLQKAVALGPPGVAMNSFLLGEILMSRGELLSAEEQFNKAIVFDPEAVSPYLSLLTLHAGQGREKRSEIDFSTAY